MANPISNFIQSRLVGPQVEKETAQIRGELKRVSDALEVKQFDFSTELNQWTQLKEDDPRELLQHFTSWVYANIHVIASRAADIHFELFQLAADGNDEELKEVHRHESLELLNRVNDHMTKWELHYLTWCYLLSMGEAAWYMVGREKNEFAKPTEIWPLRPDFLKPIAGNLSENKFIDYWEYMVPGKEKIIFKSHEILFFKDPNPRNSYRGFGVLQAALIDSEIDMNATVFNRTFFKNSAQPSAVLQTDTKLTDEQFNRIQAQWKGRFGGVGNAYKTAILESGLKWTPTQMTARDMEMLEQQRWTRDKLMAMFQNTKVILGITEDVNRANAEAGEYVWLKHNIKPKMQRIVDHLNEFFIPIYGDKLFLSFEDPLPESQEQKIAAYTAGHNKWLTTNEIRESEGLDPVAGGDAIYVPIALVPLGEPASITPGSPTVPDDGEQPTEEPAKGYLKLMVQKGPKKSLFKRFAKEVSMIRNRDTNKKALEERIQSEVTNALLKMKTAKPVRVKTTRAGEINKDIQNKRWEMFVKMAEVYEIKLAKTVEAIIARHEEETLNKIRSKYKPKKGVFNPHTRGVQSFLPDDDTYVQITIGALKQILESLALEEGQDTFDFLGITGQYDSGKTMVKLLEKFALLSGKSFVETLQASIKKALVEGVSQGEGIEDLQRRIRGVYEGLSVRTARTIARTETIRAANAATEDAFKQSGIVEAKQWFTALDERVDDECAALEGKIVDIGDNFREIDAGNPVWDNVEYPPIHPNCRCTLSPVLISKSAKVTTKAAPTEKKPEIAPIDIKAIESDLSDQLLPELKRKAREEMEPKIRAEVEEKVRDEWDQAAEELKNES
jgi:HK97 family phage portal protein